MSATKVLRLLLCLSIQLFIMRDESVRHGSSCYKKYKRIGFCCKVEEIKKICTQDIHTYFPLDNMMGSEDIDMDKNLPFPF